MSLITLAHNLVCTVYFKTHDNIKIMLECMTPSVQTGLQLLELDETVLPSGDQL